MQSTHSRVTWKKGGRTKSVDGHIGCKIWTCGLYCLGDIFTPLEIGGLIGKWYTGAFALHSPEFDSR